MPDKRVEDDGELQVVKAAEPFEVFFRREFPKMVAVAYAVSGSRWAAEELAQEAFLRAHRSWERISGYDKPGAWLRRVTINLANSYLRTRVSEVKALEKFTLRRLKKGSSTDPTDQVGRFAHLWRNRAREGRRRRHDAPMHISEIGGRAIK